MSLPVDCCTSCCTTPAPVNVIGSPGATGAAGDDGISSYAIVATGFTIPVVGTPNTVTVTFSGPGTTPTAWMVVGMTLVIGEGQTVLANPGPATFKVLSIPSDTTVVLEALGAAGDAVNPATISAGAICSPAGRPGNSISGSTTTSLTGILTGNGANIGAVTNPLPIANGGTASTSAPNACKSLGTILRLLGKVTAADFNTTADQSIANLPSKYVIKQIIVEAASVNMTTAAGGFYTGAGKTGTVIVAAAQVYTALTAATKWLDLTLAAGALSTADLLTATTIYFALTTAQGAPATANIWIFGYDLS